MPVTKLLLTVASSSDHERERQELAELHSMIMNRVVHMNIRDSVQVTMEYVVADSDGDSASSDSVGLELAARHDLANLSARQLEIAVLLCRHYSIRKIAEELYISINTVKKHIQNIKKALCLEEAGDEFVFLLAKKLGDDTKNE
ncbi:hypothetical protein GNP94_13040 [Paenibacillus campinasensis]|uniref:HTH luxR-type domain-containing protein n=1 Tax=Paenibacillus campinasensis TaxID=66347 RepID=A0ABW9T0W6_9BACL|nr:LuxR C-terminal-related transcriptional regulator [Paenibacillus campinasensis]MUG66930.1 hypothetical protein [Paenibacillus campinasensis]